jgi:glycopeptide antibiotics resistance protein
MHSLIAFLGNYSTQFWFSVLFGLLTSALLTIPIAAILYNRRGRLRVLTVLGIYLSILYAFALIFFTLFPIPEDPKAFCATHHLSPNLNPLQFVADFKEQPRAVVFQTGFNIVFFLPLGYSLRRIFRWRPWAVCVGGFLTSLFIECAQLTGVFGIFPCSYRLFDVDDLITNTLGAVLGLLIALGIDKAFPPKPVDRSVVTNPGFVRRCVAFVIDGFFISSTAWLAVVVTSMIVSLASGGTVGAAQLTGSDRVSSPVGYLFLIASIGLYEWLIPWKNGGRTLAGRYIHMSIETKPRTGTRRLAFYAVRFAVFILIFLPDRWNFLIALALLVFYCVKKQMPYDLLPGDETTVGVGATPAGAGTGAANVSGSVPVSGVNGAVTGDAPQNQGQAAARTPATGASTRNQGSQAHPGA